MLNKEMYLKQKKMLLGVVTILLVKEDLRLKSLVKRTMQVQHQWDIEEMRFMQQAI